MKPASFPGIAIATILVSGVAAPPLAAREVETPKPQLFQKMVDCRRIPDSAARLACYDEQVAKFEDATAKREVVVVDKEEMRKTRKGLFGFSLPKLGIFGGGDGDPEEDLNSIDATIASASQTYYKKWRITLEDGAKWVQIDSDEIRAPKPGQKVSIRRATMGTYFANVNGQRAIRMKREN